MLRLRYDTRRGARAWRRGSPRRCATTPTGPRPTWRASAARSRCSTPTCTSRAPASPRACRRRSRRRSASSGLRNSHLLSIAPTGTISLAFADNASNGIEPPFSWSLHAQEAHGRRHAAGVPGRGPRLAPLPARRAATRTSCRPISSPRWRSPRAAHEHMVAAVAPYVDTSISKTVNVPEDYPYEEFQDLYMARLEIRPEGPRHLPPEQGARLGAVGRDAGRAAAGLRRGRRQPPHPHQDAARSRCSPACAGPAGPSSPAAIRPGPT